MDSQKLPRGALTGLKHSSGWASAVKKAYELPVRTLFLIDLFLDPATCAEEAGSIRVVMSTGLGVAKMLTARGVIAAQVHVLHKHERITDKPSVSRVTDLRVSDDGKLVYVVDSEEQFFVDCDAEPVVLSPLLYSFDEALDRAPPVGEAANS
ncbi:hypothetical protein [Paraburkholderia sp. RL17-337-BIB-A]|uniref:hypothetical protein n=1 Tax=Paraburkholderia sp. RL17-337-BIB-A TaxID=3031636 RepID=UPI0038BAE6FC